MRPSKKEHYLNIAREVAQRSTCFRRKFGAIIVKDDVIVATGYVGAPRKTQDCFERGECLRDKMGTPHGQRYELCRSVHAEQNCVSENSLTILPTGEIEKIKKVGKITKTQLREIAKKKMADLNAKDIEQAMKIIEGTAKNMGIEVK